MEEPKDQDEGGVYFKDGRLCSLRESKKEMKRAARHMPEQLTTGILPDPIRLTP